MELSLLGAIRAAIRDRVRELYSLDLPDFAMEYPPRAEMGDLSCPVAFELARVLKRNPRQTATQIAEGIRLPEGVASCEPAGGGFLNFHLRREAVPLRLAEEMRDDALRPEAAAGGKIIVEHTNINPNKAAHIGHLRNAVLGDTLVRLLRHEGRRVEVQNYIDDTGVQVADLVVGFLHIRHMGLEQVREIGGKFDYYAWDLYSEVTAFYEQDKSRLELRGRTLKHMEEGIAPEAPLARHLAERIVRHHLATMERVGVRYDLLPWESHILALRFWSRAFDLLKETGAIRHVPDGERAGCWIMEMPGVDEGQGDEAKIIVRSNGTVTYVGKDIAYQLWKFGLLGSDFGYLPFHTYADGSVLWSTAPAGEKAPPPFGAGHEVYNVIDVRQAYLQRVVTQGLRALGHGAEADRSVHFAYEMVALSPTCARSLGYAVEEGAESRAVEMSGRRGYGVKADDLLDVLVKEARSEVEKRAEDLGAAEVEEIASKVALAALRYFMIRFTRNRVIAFDFAEVLSFEGETGPYILYSAVRAGTILGKLKERTGLDVAGDPDGTIRLADWSILQAKPVDDHWEILALLSRFDEMVAQAIRGQEPSTFARYLFVLAQKFNHFYHQFPVIQEPDAGKRAARASIAWLFRRQVSRGCALLGFGIPARM